jgi:hypothetical protein
VHASLHGRHMPYDARRRHKLGRGGGGVLNGIDPPLAGLWSAQVRVATPRSRRRRGSTVEAVDQGAECGDLLVQGAGALVAPVDLDMPCRLQRPQVAGEVAVGEPFAAWAARPCRVDVGGLPRGSRSAAPVDDLCRAGGGALPPGSRVAARVAVGGPSLGPLGATRAARLDWCGNAGQPARQRARAAKGTGGKGHGRPQPARQRTPPRPGRGGGMHEAPMPSPARRPSGAGGRTGRRARTVQRPRSAGTGNPAPAPGTRPPRRPSRPAGSPRTPPSRIPRP